MEKKKLLEVKNLKQYFGKKKNPTKAVDGVTFDIYQGEGIEDDKKSMAYSLSFLNPEATLVDEDINPAVEAVKQALIDELDASIR